MQRRRGFRVFVVLTGMLLTLGAGQLLAQTPTGEKASGSGLAPDGRTVIPADLHVDEDNAGAQDGSALRPFKTVQQAIKAAKGNAVIAVAGGSYPENIRVQEKAVRLYGGYVGGTKASYAAGTAGNFKTRDPAANPSHLKGNGKDSVVTLYEAGASIVDGFLITGGGPSSVAAPSLLGGGFYIYQGSPTISNNVIEKNQTCSPAKPNEEPRGGGIYSASANITILNNIIRNNVSGRGAGIFADGGKMVIRGNTIQNNIGVGDHGGGISINSTNAEFSYNRVEGNEIGRALGYGWAGGMIVVNVGGKYKLSHNVFTGNYAPSLGAGFFADEGAVASMDHDLVYGNKTKPDGEGAAVYVDGNENGVGSTLTLNHVTIADNISAPMVKGGAVRATWNSKLIVKNCILWNNGGDDVDADARSKATVTYTLSQEMIKGIGNLSKDPLFVNPAGRDYRLGQGSPALGAAEPAANGARANLGPDGNAAPASKKPKVAPPVVVSPPVENTPKASKAYLLRGSAGELPSQVGDDSTKLAKVESQELGGAAVQIDLIDSFGQSKAKVEDWTSFHMLCLDIINKGPKELTVEFNLFHSGTKAFATRVLAPFVLKPGKNEVRIAVKDLKNTNGSAANLAEVRRWFVSSETPVTLLVGDIFLEGKGGGNAGADAQDAGAKLDVPATEPGKPAIARNGKYMGFAERFNRYYTDPAWTPSKTVYVSPNGSGNGASRDTPASVQSAIASATPGTRIYFVRGKYQGCFEFSKKRGGTYDAPIVLYGERNQDKSIGVSITCCSSGRQTCFNFEGADYIAVDGFELIGGRYGVRAIGEGFPASQHSRGIAVLNCNGHDQDRDPFFSGAADWAVWERNVAHGAKKGDGHGIYLSNGSDWNIVRFNQTFGNVSSDFQINADPESTCKEVGIPVNDPRCDAYAGTGEGGQGASDYFLVDSNYFHHGAATGSGANFTGVRRSIVRNNIFGLYARHGVSFWQETDNPKLGSSDNKIVHNLFITTERVAIQFNTHSTRNEFVNNVILGVRFSEASQVTASPGTVLMEVDNTVGANQYRYNFYVAGRNEGRVPNAQEIVSPRFSPDWFVRFSAKFSRDPNDFTPTAKAPFLGKGTFSPYAPTDRNGVSRKGKVDLGPIQSR